MLDGVIGRLILIDGSMRSVKLCCKGVKVILFLCGCSHCIRGSLCREVTKRLLSGMLRRIRGCLPCSLTGKCYKVK